ncbi:hypothetical protein GHT06_008658 [Daphnia sinensis]|uniref:Uncharacterized protein n=1 Tax=Daphnia sinensis TaxID=1820382 RepID=A0AAD5PYN7_9CRUS|nr:hypothetical protein GHT06_008658 [Daphnia sinensis]
MRQSIRISRVHVCLFPPPPCFHSTWIRLLMTEACVCREALGAALLASVSLCVDAGQVGRTSS